MSSIQICIIGDSHVDAIKRAVSAASPDDAVTFTAQRIRRIKEAVPIGDVELPDFLVHIAQLGLGDMVVSAVGGNHYNAFGLVQHPEPFDFHLPSRPDLAPLEGREIVPFQTLRDEFASSVHGKDGDRIRQLRQHTPARMVHLCPPPPKEDAQLIMQRHETLFLKQGLLEHGVTPASIRLKLWWLQTQVLETLCKECDVELLTVPDAACTPEGYLKPMYYANDATHANPAYAALALARLKALARGDNNP